MPKNPNHTRTTDLCAEDPGLLSVEDAKRRILELVQPLAGSERLAVRDTLDRVLAEALQSNLDIPPSDNSAMDGYALRVADLSAGEGTELELVGAALAGAPYLGTVEAGQCVRITTGAVLPKGADAVVMQEQTEKHQGRIRIAGAPALGENIRRAGEDVRRGDTVLATGKRITPAELGLMASLGIAEANVRRRVRVAYFSTGDELRGVGELLAEGDIYDSNRYTLHGMLRRAGVEALDMGVIRDRRDEVRAAFREAAQIADVVITSGGVSVGEADFVKQTLEELGEVGFWRIAMKPGKPLAVGRIGSAYFFGLPGNPVSVMATFYQFVLPALQRLGGAEPAPPLVLRVPCTTALKKTAGRLEYQRGVLSADADGQLSVSTTGLQGSHVLTSMSRANCFIILPAGSEGAAAGELVEVQPFAGLV